MVALLRWSLLCSLLLCVLSARPLLAQSWFPFSFQEQSAGDHEPLIPNMIGGDSLGIPYDNHTGEARLTYQHFLRVADNNSPIPRDRIAFGYKMYHDAQIVEGGNNTFGPDQDHDLQEFQLRAEKTFLNGLMSAEIIVPWAYTTDSTYRDTGAAVATPNLNSELGNLGFGLKTALWENGTNYVTGGLLVEAPTADDRTSALGTPLGDEVWYFTPYIAGLYQATDNWFFQGFAGVRMADRSYNEVGTGRDLRPADLLTLDAGTGYRVYQSQSGLLRALTPTVELHYTHSLDEVLQNNGFGAFYPAIGTVDFLTLTAGTTAQLGDNATVAAGFAFPLRTNEHNDGNNFNGPTDRQFEWSFMLQINIFSL